MGMMLGEYEMSYRKGSVRIPAELRAHLPEEVVVFKHPDDDSIWVMSEESYEAWLKDYFVNKFGSYCTGEAKQRYLKAAITAQSIVCMIGKTGTVSIPYALQEPLMGCRNVVVVGAGDHVELWEPYRWEVLRSTAQGE